MIEAEKAHIASEKQAQSADASLLEFEAEQRTQSYLSALKSTQSEFEKELQNAQKIWGEQKDQTEKVVAIIRPLFTFHKGIQHPEEAYVQAEFKSTCPSYKISCPLTDAEVPLMKKILPLLPDKEPCERFIDFLRPSR